MEHALRFVIIFLWCVCFGFFSVMGYLDDTMTTQKSTVILVGLLASLGVYCAIEWFTRRKELQSLHTNPPSWDSIKELHPQTNNPTVSSKSASPCPETI